MESYEYTITKKRKEPTADVTKSNCMQTAQVKKKSAFIMWNKPDLNNLYWHFSASQKA